MKKLLLGLLFISIAAAQFPEDPNRKLPANYSSGTPDPALQLPLVSLDPPTCTVGQSYFNVTLVAFRVCRTPNTWVTVGGAATSIVTNTSDPATCTVGQVEINTTTSLLKFCSAVNTWSLAGGAGVTANVIPLGAGTTVPLTTSNLSQAATGAVSSSKEINGAAPTPIAFSATPTFDLSTGNRLEMAAMTANVTSVTVVNPTAGQRFSLTFLQDGTGGRTVTGYTIAGGTFVNPCGADPTLNVRTVGVYEVASDGLTVRTISCTSDDSPSKIGPLTERAAPGTPVSATATCWPDSTDHSGLECMANGSTSVFKLVLSGVDINPVTGQVTASTNGSGFSANPGPIKVGQSPPGCTAGSAGGICFGEGTAFTNAASTAGLYPDSTQHEFIAKTNGASTGGILNRTQPSAIHSTGNTAAISTATLCAAAAGACNVAGQYHVHWDFIETGTACSNVTAGSVTFLLTYTDSNATAHSAMVMPMVNQTGATSLAVGNSFTFATNLANASASGDFNISTNGTVIQYATGYTACTTGTGTYQLDASVVRIQ